MKPFRVPLRRYSEKKRKVIRKQLDSMLAEGIVEPCSSPYCSQIVIARKKDGRPRFCIDYRRLNEVTEDTAQPIPRIPDPLKDLETANIFSTMDLKTGYWQIPISSDCKKYTAFASPDGGTYQFRVIPFGLKNAPNTFQRFMSQQVLAGLLEKICIVYLMT